MPGGATVSMTMRRGWSAGSGSSGATPKAAAAKPPSTSTKPALSARECRDSQAPVRCRWGDRLSNGIGNVLLLADRARMSRLD